MINNFSITYIQQVLKYMLSCAVHHCMQVYMELGSVKKNYIYTNKLTYKLEPIVIKVKESRPLSKVF